MKKILSPNPAKCYHFVIILLSSSRLCDFGGNIGTPYDTVKITIKIRS